MMCRHGLQDCSLSPSVAERVQVLYWFSDRGSSASAIRIAIGGFVQQITLVSRPRHFGGRQWFFLCPVTGGLATVLWQPPGAGKFCSRQALGRQVAYASQFMDRDSRAHYGQSRINSRLCSIGQFEPQDWKFPPKPKGMRWKTYNRYEEKFDHYEEVLNDSLFAKLGQSAKPL